MWTISRYIKKKKKKKKTVCELLVKKKKLKLDMTCGPLAYIKYWNLYTETVDLCTLAQTTRGQLIQTEQRPATDYIWTACPNNFRKFVDL